MRSKPIRSIVVLTGAGASAESGIATFRDNNGLWMNHRVEDVATPKAFMRNAALVQEFYNQRRRQLLSEEVKANPAHFALAKLEAEFEGDVTIVTQNVDNLHEQSGSKNVIHMHGELLKMRCGKSGAVYKIETDITPDLQCECCGKVGTLRPHIVWFGEFPFYMPKIEALVRSCDLFISVGTSGLVYPAALLAGWVNHGYKIEINPNETDQSGIFDRQIPYPASIAVPRIVKEIMLADSAPNAT